MQLTQLNARSAFTGIAHAGKTRAVAAKSSTTPADTLSINFGARRVDSEGTFSTRKDAFIKAAASGNKAAILKYIELDKTDPHGIYGARSFYAFPLNMAARNGHTEIVEMLLDAKADLYSRENPDTTSLLEAARNGHKEVVKLLLSSKTDYHFANHKQRMSFINSWSHADGLNALHWAARNGHKEVVQMLIAAKADLKATDNRGMTALHWAAIEGRKEIVQILKEIQMFQGISPRLTPEEKAAFWQTYNAAIEA